MIKVKRYILILITIFILIFISYENVNKKSEKVNSFKFIGVWRVNSVEVVYEDEADYTDNILDKEIKIGSNEIKILENNKKTVSYRLKAVKSDYMLSYEKNLSISKYMNGRELIDVISVVDNSQIIGEFFLNSDTEMIFIYHGYLLNLTKVSQNVSFESEEEDKNISSEVKYDELDVAEGVMLGLKTPREKLDDMSYTEESYRTLWISHHNYRLGYVYAKENIIFPRLKGIWSLGVKKNSKNGFVVDEFKVGAYGEMSSVESEVSSNFSTNIYKSILFVANDYIAIEKYVGDNFQGNYPIYEILPVSNINIDSGLQVNEIFNENEKEKYLNELKNKIDSLSDEQKERLNIGNYDESNVTIKRELGKWRFIGKILPKNMNEDGEEFNIGILPEKRFINYNSMDISWKDLKSELGLFKDAFISPLGKIALVQFDTYIAIYKIENGMLITEPIEMIPIGENEEVIMAEWCDGSYVEQWENVFIDGDVILDDNY